MNVERWTQVYIQNLCLAGNNNEAFQMVILIENYLYGSLFHSHSERTFRTLNRQALCIYVCNFHFKGEEKMGDMIFIGCVCDSQRLWMAALMYQNMNGKHVVKKEVCLRQGCQILFHRDCIWSMKKWLKNSSGLFIKHLAGTIYSQYAACGQKTII